MKAEMEEEIYEGREESTVQDENERMFRGARGERQRREANRQGRGRISTEEERKMLSKERIRRGRSYTDEGEM